MTLRRSTKNRCIAGVCGGLAEDVGWNPNLVRFLFVAASICIPGVPGILAYLLLWVLIPEA